MTQWSTEKKEIRNERKKEGWRVSVNYLSGSKDMSEKHGGIDKRDTGWWWKDWRHFCRASTPPSTSSEGDQTLVHIHNGEKGRKRTKISNYKKCLTHTVQWFWRFRLKKFKMFPTLTLHQFCRMAHLVRNSWCKTKRPSIINICLPQNLTFWGNHWKLSLPGFNITAAPPYSVQFLFLLSATDQTAPMIRRS